MFLDICKRHGLKLDEEPSDDGRKGDNFLIVYADDFVAGFQYK